MLLAQVFRNSHEVKPLKRKMSKVEKPALKQEQSDFLRPVAALFLLAALWTWSRGELRVEPTREASQSSCRMEIVEDFPENVTNFDYSQLKHKSTYEVYLDLFGSAENEILIMDSSSNLRASQFSDEYRRTYARRVFPQNMTVELVRFKGNEIYQLLLKRGKIDKVKIRILDAGKWVAAVKNKDAEELHREGAAIRMPMEKGKEIQHAKVIIVDGKHTLITSANLDHLSLHQKGELGLLFTNCPQMAADTKQMYENWWRAGSHKPEAKRRPFSKKNPMSIGDVSVHTAMSPASLREEGRDNDFTEMVRLIDEAERRVDISVMDFIPFFMFSSTNPPVNDLTDALRKAIKRGVHVRLITMTRFHEWRNATLDYLKELSSFGVDLKLLSFEYLNVYMDRKSHGKFIITEKEGLISTSNFTPDYFFTDTGMAVVIKENGKKRTVLKQLDTIFARYWNSQYVYGIQDYLNTCVPESTDKDICDAINSSHEDSL